MASYPNMNYVPWGNAYIITDGSRSSTRKGTKPPSTTKPPTTTKPPASNEPPKWTFNPSPYDQPPNYNMGTAQQWTVVPQMQPWMSSPVLFGMMNPEAQPGPSGPYSMPYGANNQWAWNP